MLHEAQRLIERNDIDAVSIATPPNVRTELVALAAASGKHVICEKPLATTLAAGDEMIEGCARCGVQLFVYHNYLYFPETRLARKLIAEGEIGEVLATEIDRLRCSSVGGYGGLCPWMAPSRQPCRRRGPDGRRRSCDLPHRGLPWPPVDKVSADVRYDASGVDVAAYCRFGLGSGIGQLGVAWGQGGASLSIMGEEGHISFVFDEHMGYYGAPAAPYACFPAGALPQLVHARPCGTFFTPELFEDIAATIEGTDNRYPAHGRGRAPRGRGRFAAYRSAATRQSSSCHFSATTLYKKVSRACRARSLRA